MTHSWFAVMGGFALDTRDEDDQIPGEYIPGSPRVFLTDRGVRAVAALGFLPDIPLGRITDKSKADSVAKCLVVAQAGWLILQCITRVSVDLPVTTLELGTIAHAVCALLTYALWWSKPLDIHDPIVLKGSWVPSVASVLWMCSSNPDLPAIRLGRLHRGRDPELARVYWAQRQPAPKWASQYFLKESGERCDAFLESLPLGSCQHVVACEWAGHTFQAHDLLKTDGRGKVYVDTIPSRVRFFACVLPEILLLRDVSKASTSLDTVSTVDIRRWRLFLRGIREHTAVRRLLLAAAESGYVSEQENIFQELDRLDNLEVGRTYAPSKGPADWTSAGSPNPSQSFKLAKHRSRLLATRPSNWTSPGNDVSMFLVIAILYGGMHAAAWNGHFPSETEQLLWRVSSASVAAVSAAYLLGAFLYVFVSDALKEQKQKTTKHSGGEFRGRWPSSMTKWLPSLIAWTEKRIMDLFIALFAGLFLLYLLCRVFLVVEGFMGLRSLPEGAYQTPKWTRYLANF